MKREENRGLKFLVICLACIFALADLGPLIFDIPKHISYVKEQRKEAEESKKPVEEYYPDGVLKIKKVGDRYEEYRRNGTLKYARVGDEIYEYDDEENLIDGFFSEDKPKKENGEYMAYSKDGNLLLDYNYKNGKYHGIQKVYFNNSNNIYSIKEYSNGIPVGVHKTYYKNGNLETTVDYSLEKGRKITTVYYISGKESYYYDDYKNNKSVEIKYYENGNIAEKNVIIYFEDGEKMEETEERYNPNGFPKYKKRVDNIKKLEEFVKYYENGKINTITYEKNSFNLAIGKKYYTNGNIKIDNYYNKSENLVSENYYENGVLLSKAIYNGKYTHDELMYYMENREDGSKYYEMKKEQDKEIEKFFDKSGNVVYENIKQGR